LFQRWSICGIEKAAVVYQFSSLSFTLGLDDLLSLVLFGLLYVELSPLGLLLGYTATGQKAYLIHRKLAHTQIFFFFGLANVVHFSDKINISVLTEMVYASGVLLFGQ